MREEYILNELFQLLTGAVKESLLNDEIDFLTSGIEAKKKEYKFKRLICRIITIIMLGICVIILLLRYY